MKSLFRAAHLAGVCAFAANVALANGYPSNGRAIDQLRPSPDYSDIVSGRARALGILRARANGFVPSPELHDYVRGVLAKVLKGIVLPASFNPDVRVLAAPEFTALCTPDGTIIVTIGLLEQLDSEDELAFVLSHEVSHAIYRHHAHDWYQRSQYYAVMSGTSVDQLTNYVGFSFGGVSVSQLTRTARHMYRLSQSILAPQMDKDQEDAADALGFDLTVKAGYDPSAALGVMDRLAAQEAEAERIAASEKKQVEKEEMEDEEQSQRDLLTGFGGSGGGFAALGMGLFNTAVDNMEEDSTSHHPAPEREQLLSDYEFREYRDEAPGMPTPLPWKSGSTHPQGREMGALLAHYSEAENAAAYIADKKGTDPAVQASVQQSTQQPTDDHAYTQFVASEYYDLAKDEPRSEAALLGAIKGPEPSWQVYSRLLNIYIARKDFAQAQSVMDGAVTRFDNSPVLLPKRIEILHGAGRQRDAEALLPQCEGYDIKELYALCRKSAGKDSD